MANRTTEPSAEDFWNVLNSIEEGVLFTNRNGSVKFINSAASQLLGRTPRSANGAPITDIFNILRPKDLKPLKFDLKRAAAQTSNGAPYRQSILKSIDGSEYLIERSTRSILEAESNRISGYITVFRDITERDAMETRILQMEKVEAIGNLARSIAHDFNNILGIIQGYANTVTENLLPNSVSHDAACMIMEASDHAGSLTRRLLSMARAGDVEGDITLETIHLQQVVSKSIILLEGRFEEMGVSIKARLPEEPVFVTADETQLTDSLVNLLLNALEATPESGTVSIDSSSEYIESPNKTLNPKARPGEYLILRIRDTGHGIKKEHADRIFEPFFTTHDNSAAIGLGLTIVQSNVLRWGGWVRVRSRPEHGTSFRIFIPQAKAQPGWKSVEPPQKKQTRRVLIMDSDSVLASRLTRTLQDGGYKVTAKSSEVDAIQHLQKTRLPPDLIISEFNLCPNGNSLAGEAIRSEHEYKMLIMSGFSRDVLRSRIDGSSWGYIQKPFTDQQFLSVVKKRFSPDTRIRKRTSL